MCILKNGWLIFVLKKLFNVKYLPLSHHFKAIDQFPKHTIFLVKIVANATVRFYGKKV
jgi:hypothetical protein